MTREVQRCISLRRSGFASTDSMEAPSAPASRTGASRLVRSAR
jgi:hypothetical protein